LGHDGQVTDGDLLNEAMAELYSSDLGEFTERRGVLAARARAGGQPSVAKQIAALRKPTRSAWVVNQLVHADPDVAARLAALGDELRTAERSMDGARIRELSVARRQLIEALARQAFGASGQADPPAGLREEVTATLTAALADPQVTDQLRTGTLVRAARWDGFGSAPASALTPVPPAAGGHRAPPAKATAAAPAKAATTTTTTTAAAPTTVAERAAAARAAAERAAADRAAAERDRHLAAVAAAEQAVAVADRAAEAAAMAEQEQESAVQQLEEQAADARRRLSDARQEARRAYSAQRQARQALDRLRR
jgi:hypothetical protein